MALTPQEIRYQILHKDDDRSSALHVTAGTMIVLPAVAVMLRVACRRHLKLPMALDDVAIIISLVLCWALCAMLLLCAHYGSGRHTILVGVPKLEHFLQVEYAFELTYAVLITVIKVSILLFYRRIFPAESLGARYRLAWWIILVWSTLWSISVFFSATFQCLPASYYWTKVTMKTHGTCLNITALLISTAILNIVTDVGILMLPMPIVWRLQIRKYQKFAVSSIFLLGGFVCVASIIRACYLSQVVAEDPLWTNVNGGIWSVIEPGVGIVAACLPTMGAILRKTFSLQSIRQTFVALATSVRFSNKTDKSDLEKAHSAGPSFPTHDSSITDSSTREPSSVGYSMHESNASLGSTKVAVTVDMTDLPNVPPLPRTIRSLPPGLPPQ